MGFSLDFKDVFEGSVADGEYEVVVNHCGENATPGGAEYIELDLIIRNDVDQPHKNQHIFHKIWKAKETGKFNMKSFNTIGKACNLPAGKSYSSLPALLEDFTFKTARVNVKNEASEYKGKTYTNTNVKYWSPTKLTHLTHEFKGKISSNEPVTIDENDLPF